MSITEPLYFELSDAVELLSKRLSISNLTPKKIIRYIDQFKIPLHLYGFGFSVTGDFMTSNNYNKPSDNFLYSVEKDLSAWNIETGSLFEIPERYVSLFQFHKTLLIDQFNDMVPLKTLHFANNAVETIEVTLRDKEKKVPYFEVLALYPYLKVYYDDKNEILNGSLYGVEILPKFKLGELDDEDTHKDNFEPIEVGIEHFIVNFEDLIILNDHLNQLEAYVSGEKIYIAPNVNLDHKMQPKLKNRPKNTGISPQKVYAKSTAKNFAKYFWSQDKKQEIKIGQMCEKVYFALFETEYKDQLPEQFISIKSWIKEVAPDYASEAGRNKE